MLPADALPLVSCVMPTANRRGLVPHAIRYFLRQAYPHKELVILDDGTDAVADLVPDDPQVRYVRLGGPLTLGAKRNEGVRLSRGGLIMHWDDDDWMAPHRIRYQVDSLLQQAGAEVCGLRRMLFHDVGTGRTWLYEYPASERPWLAGGSLLYTRAFWQRSPFPAIDVGEDTQFVWSHSLERAVVLPEYRFYVATIHPGNTSPKACAAPYWTPWPGDLQSVMGEEDMSFYRSWPASWSAAVPATAEIPDVATGGPAVPATAEAPGIAAPAPADAQPPTATAARAPRDDRALPRDYGTPHSTGQPATYSIVMVTHNTREMTQMATLRTLRHSAGSDARLIVVDNGSTDGTETWLDLLAQRGDIDLIRSQTNLGHGPAIELARRAIRSPYLVTLDSDAFPLVDDWLSRLASRLNDRVTVAGIRHHRDYIHPSCLIMPCNLLDDWGLTFLDEKDRPSQLDVAERISHEVKRRGYQIAGLERTGARRRGSVSEPVYLGAEYEGIVYHQWYTTRAALAAGGPVDDVPPEAIAGSLDEVLRAYQDEPRALTVVVGVRASPDEPQRLRNALATLRALNFQDLPRWRYRLLVVEQDRTPRLEAALAPLADRYIFAYNPGAYNRGWAYNVGAAVVAGKTDVLCLIDADLLVPPDFLRRGLAAMAEQRAVLPYTEVLYLGAASTEQAIHDRFATPMDAARPAGAQGYGGQLFTTSQGGTIWVEAALYHQIGGHDERFRGWGYEDREFWDRLARATTISRLLGRLLHLDHPRTVVEDGAALTNQRLYEQVRANPAARLAGPIGDPRRYAAEAGEPSASGAGQSTDRADTERSVAAGQPAGDGGAENRILRSAQDDSAGARQPPGGAGDSAGIGRSGGGITEPVAESASGVPLLRGHHPSGEQQRQSLRRPLLDAQAGATLGRRAWENWHRWDLARIERIVADELRLPPQASARRRLAEIVVRLGDTLLDAGCGPGALWPHLEPYRRRFSWTGADVTAAMVQVARRLFPGVPVYHADAGCLPFEDRSFDVVLLRHVLEHLPHTSMEAAVAEALRVARKAVVIDFYVPPLARGPRQTTPVGGQFLETRWTAADVEAPIARAGWQVRERSAIAGGPAEADEVWISTPATIRMASLDASPPANPDQLKISIVMPTYRRPHTIRRAVETIRNQTYCNWELIIVDNAGDGAYAFDDPRIRVYCHTARPSASYARNQGLQYVTGDLVCFFDDDDEMFPTYLERFATAFHQNPGAKLARCGMIVSGGQMNFSYATPECCLRRAFAMPTWSSSGVTQDQVYFRSIISFNRWSEERGDIVVIPDVLCRANADPRGGVRSGGF